MADYECPNCGGGFPENPDKECPWCSQSIDGSYGNSRIVQTVPDNTSGGGLTGVDVGGGPSMDFGTEETIRGGSE